MNQNKICFYFGLSLIVQSTLMLLFSMNANSFVDNVTHGYVSCISCHVSPSGGGLLNDYGRSLSRELMSTWGWKNSDDPLFGAIKNTKHFKYGGDIRTIQTYFENSEIKQGKQFTMQKNIELGGNINRVWFVGTAGVQEGPPEMSNKGRFLSESHYLLWDLSDELKLRIGKFRLNYGLLDPNHIRFTRSALGFGLYSSSYILEFSKLSERDEIFISTDLGRMDLAEHLTGVNTMSEKSVSVNYARFLSEDSKWGGNLLFGDNNLSRRTLLGTYGIVKLAKNGIFKLETNYQQSNASDGPAQKKELVVGAVSIGYQGFKGSLPYLILEHLQKDLMSDATQQSAIGLGFQWLPIPHLEFQTEFKKQNNKGIPVSQSDEGWFLIHFYL